VICVPAEASTLSWLSLIPERVRTPEIRTTGKGCINGSEELTGIRADATLECPLASLTRSCTRWLPAEENVVLVVAPPAEKAPVPARSHANAVIGLALSVELDINDTA
jgi:hypothetical protein